MTISGVIKVLQECTVSAAGACGDCCSHKIGEPDRRDWHYPGCRVEAAMVYLKEMTVMAKELAKTRTKGKGARTKKTPPKRKK